MYKERIESVMLSMAQMMALIANCHSTKKTFKPSDFYNGGSKQSNSKDIIYEDDPVLSKVVLRGMFNGFERKT